MGTASDRERRALRRPAGPSASGPRPPQWLGATAEGLHDTGASHQTRTSRFPSTVMSEANVVQALRYTAPGYHGFNKTLSWYDSSTIEEQLPSLMNLKWVCFPFLYFN